jgi:uncharacterized protein (TIGR00297 family)
VTLEARALIGVLVAAGIGGIAWRTRSLSRSGALAAIVAGTVAAAAGWSWAMLLIGYFVSSTLLSRLGRATKREHSAGMVEKPGARDAWQVLSNGLPFMIAAACHVAAGSSSMLWMAAAAGSLAASAADTWATEIGTLVGQQPRSIVTMRRLAVGQSGGVTAAGSVASLAGAAFVATIAAALQWPATLLIPVFLGGVAGSIGDSLAGALLQRRSWCDACGSVTEMRVHDCGSTTRPAGGLPFVGNDLVNLLATVIGALVAVGVATRLV